jgi:hypothetical protein
MPSTLTKINNKIILILNFGNIPINNKYLFIKITIKNEVFSINTYPITL